MISAPLLLPASLLLLPASLLPPHHHKKEIDTYTNIQE